MIPKLLFYSRFLLLIPVFGCLILTVGTVVMGMLVTVTSSVEIFSNAEFSTKTAKQLSVAVIETIDIFLVGALGYIAAVGIYKLFISQQDEQLLKRFKIETLTDLENKIFGVVVAALAIAFLGDVSEAKNMSEILRSGVGISLTIAALAVFMWITGAKKDPAMQDGDGEPPIKLGTPDP